MNDKQVKREQRERDLAAKSSCSHAVRDRAGIAWARKLRQQPHQLLTMTLNWKVRGNRRYEALASRIVGGKYFIEWVESRYSDDYCQHFEVRSFSVDYQQKGSSGRGNVSLTTIRTLAKAKALAEFHHAKREALILEYGGERAIPEMACSQFMREILDWQRERTNSAKENSKNPASSPTNMENVND